MIGQKFTRLTVLNKAPKKKGESATKYLCKCDCGSEGIYTGSDLTAGRCRSCGCLSEEIRKNSLHYKIEMYASSMEVGDSIDLDTAHKLFGGGRPTVSRSLCVLYGKGVFERKRKKCCGIAYYYVKADKKEDLIKARESNYMDKFNFGMYYKFESEARGL